INELVIGQGCIRSYDINLKRAVLALEKLRYPFKLYLLITNLNLHIMVQAQIMSTISVYHSQIISARFPTFFRVNWITYRCIVIHQSPYCKLRCRSYLSTLTIKNNISKIEYILFIFMFKNIVNNGL